MKKWKIHKIQSFCLHLFSHLAKFQTLSSITAKVDSKNVFLRYRDFKFRVLFLTKIGLFLPNIFKNSKILLDFVIFYGLVCGDTLKNITKQVWKSFWEKKNHDLVLFWASFSYWKIHGKGRFLSYPA